MAQYTKMSEILLKFTQSLGKVVYDRSQELVPVKSGQLKASGSYSFNTNGATIVYGAPYASKINFRGGDTASDIDPTKTYVVKQHQRKVPTGITTVREHTRRVGDRKPIQRRTTAKGFLDQAKEDVLSDTKYLERAWAKAHGTSTPTLKITVS